ncbi:protein mono-ADP-ribosyltransferase PARP14-like [Amphiura filiformis]|uniref:protein mono-ADP-ribosyltransferase PARP14-like n=1 Tax=Amphiura filiformis TaxID=82378 RepID=UPI003B221F97
MSGILQTTRDVFVTPPQTKFINDCGATRAERFQDNKPSEELEYPSIQQQQLVSLEQHVPPVYSNPLGPAETESAQRYSSFDDVKLTSTNVGDPHPYISNQDSVHSPQQSTGQEHKRDDDEATPFDSMMDMSRVSLSPQSFSTCSMQIGARNTATPSNIPPLRADFETRPSNIAPLRADYETHPDHAGNQSDSSRITVLDGESRHTGIAEQHASIDVSGYQNAGTVRRYFTKEAKLVGGTITEGGFVEDPRTGKINITFTDSKVVEAVLKKSHDLEGRQLKVVQAVQKTPPEMDKRCLLLTGLPTTDSESLFYFLEAKTGIHEDPILEYSKKYNGVALVRYPMDIADVRQTLRGLKGQIFKNTRIDARPVYKSDCILVKGIPSGTHKDTIKYFFEEIVEKEKGEQSAEQVAEYISAVHMKPDRQALVFLNDIADVDRILRVERLSFENTALTVEAFSECLGSSTGASFMPDRCLPAPFTVDVKLSITEFIMQNTKYREKLKARLLQKNAQFVWPYNENQQKMRIEPVINEEKDVSWKEWGSKVLQLVKQYYNQYDEQLYSPTDRPHFEAIMTQVANIYAEHDVRISVINGKQQFLLRGLRDNVQKMIAAFKKELEKRIAQRKIESTTDFIGFKPAKIKQFESCRIIEKMRQKYPNVKATLQKEERRVKLEGETTAVGKARLLVSETLNNLISRRPKLNTLQVAFVIGAESEICDIFQDKDIRASCVEDDTVKVTAETETAAKNACAFLEKDIEYRELGFRKPEELSVFQNQDGDKFIQSLNESLTVVQFDPRRGCVEIAGFRDTVGLIEKSIAEYVQANAEKEYFISYHDDKPVTEAQVRYLQIHFGNIEIHRSVRVSWQYEPKPEISFKGKAEDVKMAIQVVRDQIQKIIEKSHPVSRTGIHALQDDQAFLDPIQKRHKCYIKIIEKEHSRKRRTPTGVTGPSTHPSVLQECKTPSGQTLQVCLGDLTLENVDGIVNAANTKMNHEGGVALAIVEAGGHVIQDESYKIINGIRELTSGELIVTGAGDLHCKKIIHVVGPRWSGGHNQEMEILYDAITNVLQEAGKLRLATIAIPAISSGIYGFPVDLCAQTIVRATAEHFTNHPGASSVRTVRFTNIKEEVCKAFKDAINDVRGTLLPFQNRDSRADTETSVQEARNGRIPAAIPVTATANSSKIKTAEGKTIQLKKANLSKEKVDVIVNTAGSKLNLNQGAVSRAILAVAGKGLQQECDTKLQGGNVDSWSFITTGPAKLKCRTVYHLVCPAYDESNKDVNEKEFVNAVKDIFEDIDNKGMKSVAVPAIGTGNLDYPPNDVARMMYEAAILFSKDNPRGPLQDIRFIQYPKDRKIIKAFKDVMQIHVQHGLQTTSQTTPAVASGYTPSSVKPSDPTEKTYTGFGQDDEDDTYRMRIGQIVVELNDGDILTANTDVIVNSTNEEFDLEGPLSRAIIRRAGETVRDECEKISGDRGAMRAGVAMTSAGNLRHSKHIAHIMMDRDRDDVTILKDRIQKTLEMTDEWRMTSIAFPAIGTGVSGFGSPKDAARALFKALGTFAVSDPKSLLLVKIIIFDSSMLRDYKSVMRAQEGESFNLGWPQRKLRQLKSGVETVMKTPGMIKNYLYPSGSESSVDAAEEAKEAQDTIIFHIIAGDDQVITAVVSAIDKYINSKFTQEEIPYDRGSNGELTRRKREEIKSAAIRNETSVQFMVRENMKSSRLIIRGRTENVFQTKAEIFRLLGQFQKEENYREAQRKENELLSKSVQWKYGDVYYQPYDIEINAQIETAHKEGKSSVDLELEDDVMRIDFIRMVESSKRGTFQVRRSKPLQEAIQRMPNHWDPNIRKGPVEIPKGCAENRDVVDSFYTTCKEEKHHIVKIERIQNIELFAQYMAKRDSMALERSLQPEELEKKLFHGTAAKHRDAISKNGFNRRFNGVNGTLYGDGTYFATDAAYSTHYSKADESTGLKYMFRAKVLTGKYTKGKEGMKTLELDSDSAVDDIEDPSMYVVFHDVQAYPEYLITFKRMTD